MRCIFSKVVATKTVLFFICAAIITIEDSSCTTNATIYNQQSSSPSDDVNRNGTATTVEAELLQSAVLEETIVQKNATAVNSKKRTCACDDNEEALICASNGVTYKNACRFDCAKARVTLDRLAIFVVTVALIILQTITQNNNKKGLRQIKQGRCSQATGSQSYWQSKTG